jgi:brefeldin A-inhibited guanine nucleotide-exchange protein
MNPQSAYVIRSKALCLELIFAILDNPGPTFLSRREFIDIIKDQLIDGLLKNCLNTDKSIFALSFGIFTNLALHFREHLKQAIFVFLDQIFLKILDSNNSSYHQRLLTLQVFAKLLVKPRHVLEFFVNYDCDTSYINVTERIVEHLVKIAQGKYSKSEYANLIHPHEEHILRSLALETLVSMVKSIASFAQEFDVHHDPTELGRKTRSGTTTYGSEEDKDPEISQVDESKETLSHLDKADQYSTRRMVESLLASNDREYSRQS